MRRDHRTALPGAGTCDDAHVALERDVSPAEQVAPTAAAGAISGRNRVIVAFSARVGHDASRRARVSGAN